MFPADLAKRRRQNNVKRINNNIQVYVGKTLSLVIAEYREGTHVGLVQNVPGWLGEEKASKECQKN
jgi:hypothetical protein